MEIKALERKVHIFHGSTPVDERVSQAIATRAAEDGCSYNVQFHPLDSAETIEMWSGNFQSDLFLIVNRLGELDKWQLCRELRRRSRQSSTHTPILFVSDDISETQTAFEAGADDFCLIDQCLQQLGPRIGSVMRLKNISDSLKSANESLRSANENLSRLTITDDLTGLYNMRYYQERLVQEFIRAHRYEKYLSVIMFDIDHFKEVNDRCNHLMGSYVISEVGRHVHASIRAVDIGARFGGDEFVIMLPETGPEGAHTTAARIRDVIRQEKFSGHGFEVGITISMGISTFEPNPDTAESGTELMRQADEMLYKAKDSGRDRIVSKPTMHLAS